MREDYRAGLVASLVYNPNRRKGSSALSAEDFFPGLVEWLAENRGDDPEADIEQLLAHVRKIHERVAGEG